MDNWDDSEGYYCMYYYDYFPLMGLLIIFITVYRSGELLEGRYQIYGNVGRGVFSSVLRAKDITTNQDVAIKVIRNNDVMYKAGQKELTLLKLLASRDPEDKKHCIRLLSHFEFKNHLCLVFEAMAYLYYSLIIIFCYFIICYYYVAHSNFFDLVLE